jgi:hypothetical protein
VLVVSAGACSSDADRAQNGGSASPAGTAGERNNGSATTVTGCLQQGEGNNDFILTQVNAQPGPIATSGENESSAVQQKQREAASRAYRLSGGPDNLRELVGHEVRVTGTVSDRGDVQSRDQDRPADQDDLARMEVSSAESVGQTCRGGAAQNRDRGRPQD